MVDQLSRFADERGVPLPQLAVAWVIHQPAVDVAIVGARLSQPVDALTPAASIESSSADVDKIETILAGAVPVTGPAPEGM